MNLKIPLLISLISFLPATGGAQDYAWQLRHTGPVTNVGINPLNPNTVFTIIHYYDSEPDTVIVSYDKGLTWSTVTILPPAPYLHSLYIHPTDTLVVFGIHPNVMRSSDYGLTWDTVLAARPPYGYLIPFAIDPIHPDTLFAGTIDGGVYRSTDRGITWDLISEVGPDLCSLAIRPDSTNVLYAGWAGKISKSNDGGFSWRLIATTGSDEIPFIVIDFSNPKVAYTTAHFETSGQDSEGVWKTTDGGEHWGPINTPSPTYWYMDISRSSPAVPYVATLSGSTIWRSTDEGTSWEALDPAPFAWIEDLRVHPLNDDVWVGGAGLYLWAPVVSTVQGMPQLMSTYRLEQNYPNPFNPSTSIRYGLPVKSHVLLEVFNILGKRVTTLVDGEQEAGYHSALLKGRGLASGLYLYRLHAGGFVETKKLIILR